MSYNYETEKAWLFTDEGQRCLFKANENVRTLLEAAGAFVGFCALKNVSIDDTWKMLAVIDRLVELGAIREVTSGVWAQDRVFVDGKRR